MEKLFAILEKVVDFWKRRSTAGKVFIGVAAFLIYAVGHGLLVNAGVLEKNQPVVSPTTQPAAVEDKAPYPQVVVHSYLRQTLNDWDSYEDVSFSEPEIIEHKGKNVYHVVHRYRAKNGFGALRLMEQDFYYTHGGEMVDASEAR